MALHTTRVPSGPHPGVQLLLTHQNSMAAVWPLGGDARPDDDAVHHQGRYQDVRDNLQVKEVRLDEQPGVRWIICHNPEQVAKDKTDRDRQLDAVRAELERITALRAKVTPAKATPTKGTGKDVASEPAAHVTAECALRDHKALGKWVKQTPRGGCCWTARR